MVDQNRLVDQCVHKGLMYLAEALQYYLPTPRSHAYPPENNIALHLARSFAEKNFQVWAEIPIMGESNGELDFLAWNYTENITVALEFKRDVESPRLIVKDLMRLVKIHKKELLLCRGWPGDGQNTTFTGHKMYGMVTMLHTQELAKWWHHPAHKDYMPEVEDQEGKKQKPRDADGYRQIAKAIENTWRGIVPLEDFFRYSKEQTERYRFCYGAYALYDETNINTLEDVLK